MKIIRNISPWRLQSAKQYDLLLATIGYERRSRHICEFTKPLAAKRLAIGFDRQRQLSYAKNLQWFGEQEFAISECSDHEFLKIMSEALIPSGRGASKTLRVMADVSSMSRVRIASLILAISTSKWDEVTVDFLYTPAKYTPPQKEMSQIESVGPVLNDFAGWSDEPEKPTAAVFGLGYEYDRAVGALEYIEPSYIWAFKAIGEDSRYDRASEDANRIFYPNVSPNRRLAYKLIKPYECFVNLESLVYGLLRDTRPIIIPFGPKLFMLCSMLVATIHYPRVAVWRVSSGQHDVPVDRHSDGTIVGLSVTFTSEKGVVL